MIVPYALPTSFSRNSKKFRARGTNNLRGPRRPQNILSPMLIILGGSGVGLVWGWLVAHIFASGQKSLLNILSLGLATLLILIEAIWLAGWRSAAFVLGAAATAFLVHLAWRQKLST